jgi:hypothetical protein
MKQQDSYMEPTVMHFPGMVARIYRPILTEAERARRMSTIHKQAERLLKKVT